MQKKLTIALDIDGTLIDKTGRLDPRVMPIFSDADLSMTKFIFVTGGTYKAARIALKQINEKLSQDTSSKNYGKTINGYIATNSGGQIYASSGQIIYDSCLEPAQISQMASAVRKVDSSSVLIYVADDTYFIESQDELKFSRPDRFIVNSALMHIFKGKESKKGEAGLDFGEVKKLTTKDDIHEFATSNGGIKSLYVVPTSVSKDKKTELFNALRASAGDLEVYKGFAIEVPSSTKKTAVQFILDKQKNNPAFVDDISQVVYFGDGLNDVEMLETCNVSVARGEQAKEVAKRVAKFAVCDCEQFASQLYGGCYDLRIDGKSEASKSQQSK